MRQFVVVMAKRIRTNAVPIARKLKVAEMVNAQVIHCVVVSVIARHILMGAIIVFVVKMVMDVQESTV